jgi:4-amino-4-deoxy-L-arabinose transferase-like glycosyltransferase
LADLPASVYWDEASIGYNAYSIATDLKDEWGNFLPVHFRAFGEFKLPVYIYSVVPFVKIFGLNAFSVRLPAVIYSLGTLVLTYLLVGKITGKKWTGVLAGFILSVSPWFFIFSRAGYEAGAGLSFFLLGTYLFLFIEKRRLFLFLGILSFILSFYSYNSFRVIIPIWLVILFTYYVGRIKDKKKYLVVTFFSILLFLLSLIPVYRLYKFDAGGVRFAQVEITNKFDFFKNYAKHFDPKFLFEDGDTNPRSQIPGHGQLYLIDIPLAILGVFVIFKKRSFLFLMPLLFLLIAPIPASLTRESPHALRSILAVPAFVMINAIGVWYIAEKRISKKFSVIFISVISIIYYLSFELYAMDFVLKYQNLTKHDWQYEYKEIFINQKSGVVTDKYAQPYIFALFYQKIPPSEFRSSVKYNPVDKWGFSLVSSFNDFQFK